METEESLETCRPACLLSVVVSNSFKRCRRQVLTPEAVHLHPHAVACTATFTNMYTHMHAHYTQRLKKKSELKIFVMNHVSK